MKVYLCGGINGLSDSDCSDWRDYVKSKLNCETLDPMRRDYRGKEDESVDEIIEGDKADIFEANVVLVNAVRPSWGTAMEVMFAHFLNKRILSVCPGDSVSPWLRYHSTRLFKDFDQAVWSINENLEKV